MEEQFHFFYDAAGFVRFDFVSGLDTSMETSWARLAPRHTDMTSCVASICSVLTAVLCFLVFPCFLLVCLSKAPLHGKLISKAEVGGLLALLLEDLPQLAIQSVTFLVSKGDDKLMVASIIVSFLSILLGVMRRVCFALMNCAVTDATKKQLQGGRGGSVQLQKNVGWTLQKEKQGGDNQQREVSKSVSLQGKVSQSSMEVSVTVNPAEFWNASHETVKPDLPSRTVSMEPT